MHESTEGWNIVQGKGLKKFSAPRDVFREVDGIFRSLRKSGGHDSAAR